MLTKLHLAISYGQDYVFAIGMGPDADTLVKRQNMWGDFQALREKLGVPQCSFHTFRKSYGTSLARAVPLHIVQEMAGQAGISTTQKHYLHVRDTVDTCDASGDICVSSPRDSLCDDGSACSGAEFYDAVPDCQTGTGIDCDEGDSCTINTCVLPFCELSYEALGTACGDPTDIDCTEPDTC